MTQEEKLLDVEQREDGTLVHRHILTEDGMSRLTFDSQEGFDKWAKKKLDHRAKNI